MLVEVCANSLKSALNAQEAGANRIELCSELGVGGVTPSFGLMQLVRKQLNIPVHVLIRPRSAHFTYTDEEFAVMLADIAACKSLGINGIVSGVLLADGSLDEQRTAQLVAAAKPLHFTFHRAFDWLPDPLDALAALEKMGVDTVLTSGQQTTALAGADQLGAWQKTTSITIMAGGGVGPQNANTFKNMGLSAVHLSGTAFGNAVPLADKISMNSDKHLAEHQVAVTKTETIRLLIESVK